MLGIWTRAADALAGGYLNGLCQIALLITLETKAETKLKYQ